MNLKFSPTKSAKQTLPTVCLPLLAWSSPLALSPSSHGSAESPYCPRFKVRNSTSNCPKNLNNPHLISDSVSVYNAHNSNFESFQFQSESYSMNSPRFLNAKRYEMIFIEIHKMERLAYANILPGPVRMHRTSISV